MTPPCGPTATPEPEEAATATTAAAEGLPELPPLPGINDSPTDPGCRGSRHGSLRAYRTYGCTCPDVIAHVLADAERRRAARAVAQASGERHRPAWEVDDGDVDAAVWAARRWLPFPANLTSAEQKAVVLRLSRMGLSAGQIEARTGISDRTVDRYLEQAKLFAAAVDAIGRGQPVPALPYTAVQRDVVLHLSVQCWSVGEIADRLGLRRSLVNTWIEDHRRAAARLAAVPDDELVAA